MKHLLLISILMIAVPCLAQESITPTDIEVIKSPAMKWAVTSPEGKSFSKDPSVVRFDNRYLMYFSLPPHESGDVSYGWHVGIAQSDDLTNWKLVGEVTPMCPGCKRGLAAPCARVWDNKVHLFFQSYGNGNRDAIYYAQSSDGIKFSMVYNDPIFAPKGNWSNGRAIDADFIQFKGKCLLFAATRDPNGKIQKQCMAIAEDINNLSPDKWTCIDHSILEPELKWEGACIEAATTIVKGDTLYMFYAGGYNCSPQQIGLAKSTDGINWTRVWDKPFIPNGPQGQWNQSESGHPGVFQDESTGKTWLFFQGCNDNGKSWYLSRVELDWSGELPTVNQ